MIKEVGDVAGLSVSMKSGLEGRNKPPPSILPGAGRHRVSMKSGLEGRNKRELRHAIEYAKRLSQ